MGKRTAIASATFGLIVASCHRAPPAKPAAVSIPAAAPDSATPALPARASGGRCPIVAMKLVVQASGQAPLTMLTLDATGDVTVHAFAGDSLHAKLDRAGCLVGPDGLWAELTPGGVIWTEYETLDVDVDGAGIRLPEGALRIRADGTVERLRADGSVESGFMRLEGYRTEGRCAGELLLATFLAMMPSMAVSDGHPAMAPVPKDSTCSAYGRPAK